MLIRREVPEDVESIRTVHAAAFGKPDADDLPVEVNLVDALRASDAWVPELSLVATDAGAEVTGHVVCTRAHIGSAAVLGLGPIGVLPDRQGKGVGSALMHAVLGAADALGEPLVALLGHTDYYPRFGFRPAKKYGITPPVAAWESHFQARPSPPTRRPSPACSPTRHRSTSCSHARKRSPLGVARKPASVKISAMRDPSAPSPSVRCTAS